MGLYAPRSKYAAVVGTALVGIMAFTVGSSFIRPKHETRDDIQSEVRVLAQLVREQADGVENGWAIQDGQKLPTHKYTKNIKLGSLSGDVSFTDWPPEGESEGDSLEMYLSELPPGFSRTGITGTIPYVGTFVQHSGLHMFDMGLDGFTGPHDSYSSLFSLILYPTFSTGNLPSYGIKKMDKVSGGGDEPWEEYKLWTDEERKKYEKEYLEKVREIMGLLQTKKKPNEKDE